MCSPLTSLLELKLRLTALATLAGVQEKMLVAAAKPALSLPGW